jgi:peptidoglycan/LPS O-acetylase OafA/YrhL
VTHSVQENQNRIRDVRFDILKATGLFCIILAHVNPGKLILQLRNFDVPLMVIVSGALFYYSSSNKHYSFWEYLKLRIIRLIAPVWFFLVFFFVSAYVISFLEGENYPFSLKKILGSFLLLDGIGYVWIVRVFILVAAISIFLLKLQRYLASDSRFLSAIFAFYILYELLFLILDLQVEGYPISMFVLDKYLFYIIPYGCLFGLGITLPRMSRKTVLSFLIASLLLFLIFVVYYYYQTGHFVPTQHYKYPARIYYLSYGIFMSLLTFIVVSELCNIHKIHKNYEFLMRFIIFVSSASLWIYLWHIFFLQCQKLFIYRFQLSNNFLVSFLVVTFLSVAVTYLQREVINKMIVKTKFGRKNCALLTTLFLK